jgi:hypothetical protein
MTKRFKDFGYGKAAESTEPLVFKLYDEEFECYPRIQGKVLLDIISESAAEDSGATARVIVGFFSKVMKEESYVRFEALINDKEKIVEISTLSDIISWLITEYGDRPNPEPEDSSNGL